MCLVRLFDHFLLPPFYFFFGVERGAGIASYITWLGEPTFLLLHSSFCKGHFLDTLLLLLLACIASALGEFSFFLFIICFIIAFASRSRGGNNIMTNGYGCITTTSLLVFFAHPSEPPSPGVQWAGALFFHWKRFQKIWCRRGVC